MTDTEEDNICEVERVVGCRMYKGKKQYFIKWVGYPPSENTWENLEDMQCDRLIAEFEARRRQRSIGSVKESSDKEKVSKSKKEDNDTKFMDDIKRKYNLPDNRTIPNLYDCLVKGVEEIKKKGKRRVVVVRYVDGSQGEVDFEVAKIGLPLHMIDFYESKSK